MTDSIRVQEINKSLLSVGQLWDLNKKIMAFIKVEAILLDLTKFSLIVKAIIGTIPRRKTTGLYELYMIQRAIKINSLNQNKNMASAFGLLSCQAAEVIGSEDSWFFETR